MKQGTGSSSAGDQKREPISKAVSPAAVANIGIQQVYTKTPPALNSGRGFTAPAPTSSTSHPSGSQGKHR